VSPPRYRFVFLGLSITSSWGNGHATTYRALLSELCRRGHDVLFLERDLPFYADNRDLPEPPFGRTELYDSLEELRDGYADELKFADVVIVGSYVPQGREVIDFVLRTARGKIGFYDIDTPITLAKLCHGLDAEYLALDQIPKFDVYLSFTGGPTLEVLERRFGARRARPLYCSVDPALYHPDAAPLLWDLGYLGTYSADRQPALSTLLIEPARKLTAMNFCVVGPQYPESIDWPANVVRLQHLSPSRHRAFYNSQRFTLNVTRREMIASGHSPSVRLFEAAACGTTIISDAWEGLERLFSPGIEILLARDSSQVEKYLNEITEEQRLAIAGRARDRVLGEHTSAHRVESLEKYVAELFGNGGSKAKGRERKRGAGDEALPKASAIPFAVLETSQEPIWDREKARSKA
jgi:spore maturation protein CgeB